MKKILYSTLVLGSILFASCSKEFTKNDLNSSFSQDKIESLLAFPESAMIFMEGLESGTYQMMFRAGIAEAGQHEDFGQKAVDIIMDAMSNDVAYGNVNWFSYAYMYQDRLEAYNTATIYNYYSKLAHNANVIIQNLIKVNPNYATTDTYGRALALRAFANFYLLRLYESDKLGTSMELVNENPENGALGELVYKYNRVPSQEMKESIEKDLTIAFKNLENYSRKNINFINQQVVAGILSRFYLYTEDFGKAKDYASIALGGKLEFEDFNVVNAGHFSNISNQDWLWASAIDGSTSAMFASYFSHMDSFNVGYGRVGNTTKSIDKRLYDEMNGTDVRKSEWFADGVKIYTSNNWKDGDGKLVPKQLNKYINTKFVDETKFLGDYSYMRKTEMLFNYIEASIKLGDESGAKDLLVGYMKSRDAKYSIGDRLSKRSLFEEFQIQKRIEFWGEGFGLLDMKRWGISLDRTYKDNNHISQGQIKVDYPSAEFTLQFPRAEINSNLLLRPQNPVK